MTQQQAITSFLDSGVSTPAANQAADQSARTKKTSRTNKVWRKTLQSPSDPPQRTRLKRKRITKEEKKREPKRVNRPRKCKASNREIESTPTKTDITPMPSPEQDNMSNPREIDSADISIINRSLTDMLAPGTFTSQSTPSAAESGNNDVSSERSARLQAQITSAALALEHELSEKRSLNNAMDLLQKELEQYKRKQKNLQNEVKRLTSENDNLRRELSHYKGMRKYVVDNHDSTKESGSSDTSNHAMVLNEELATTKAKLASLREHVIDIGKTLISAADADTAVDGNQSFTEVVPRRNRRQGHISSRTPESDAIQSISVVIGTGRNISDNNNNGYNSDITTSRDYAGACRRNVTHGNNPNGRQQHDHSVAQRTTTTQSDATSQRRRVGQPYDNVHQTVTDNLPTTLVVGTSLVRGLGSRLNNLGNSATTFTYPGRDIPYIRSRIQNIVPKQNPPERIVLQCGGNDAEQVPAGHVINEYDRLVSEVRRCCPRAKVILSTIPSRGNNANVHENIDLINSWLKRRSHYGDGVYCIDVCPQLPGHSKRDMTHFNAKGLNVYAKRLSVKMSNFSRFHSNPRS